MVCDETNNGDGTAAGMLLIDVSFTPVRPGEFLTIRITQQTADQ
ncbi:hypothetical protein [Streptomyces sp. NPDC055287]